MSLETQKEEMLENTIVSNGVMLQPMKLEDGRWGWVAVSIEDDSFYDGDCIENNYSIQTVFSESKEDLLKVI